MFGFHQPRPSIYSHWQSSASAALHWNSSSSSITFQISLEEKKTLLDKLVNSSYAVSGITVEDQDFYKVSDSSLSFEKTKCVKCLCLIRQYYSTVHIPLVPMQWMKVSEASSLYIPPWTPYFLFWVLDLYIRKWQF